MKRINLALLLLVSLTLVLAACDSGMPTATPNPTPTVASAATATIALPASTPSAPAATPTVSASDEESITLARKLITQLSDGDFDEAVSNFDATMSSQLPTDKLKGVWDQLTAQFGAFKEQGQAQSGHQDVYTVVVITCTFEKGPLDARVVLDAQKKIAGLFFAPSASATPVSYTPPNYVQESSFTEQEMSFGDPEWVLTGTLTMPKAGGPHPAVVLVHGSGPQDRDETIGGSKVFKDLAWGLASQGVAVFRYEKRTLAYGAKMATSTDQVTIKEETVDDAVMALEMLAGIEGIEPSRVFLVGHSLGAMLAPMISESTEAEKGFVTLAAPSRPLEDLVLEQYNYLANLDGSVTTEEQKALDDTEQQVANVKKLEPGSQTPPDQLPLGLPASYWLSLKGYDPPSVAKDLIEPMLILQGERDFQVTMVDFHGWENVLQGKEDVTFKSFPNLNHLFIPGTGPSSPDEYNKPGHVAEAVVRDIADWIERH